MILRISIQAIAFAALVVGIASAQPKKFNPFDFDKKGDPFTLDKKGEVTLVGKWTATSEKNKGLGFEFTKEGEAKVSVSSGVVTLSYAGNYKLNDRTLDLMIDDPNTKGEKKTAKLTVKSLTEDELVIEDKGVEEKLKRAK